MEGPLTAQPDCVGEFLYVTPFWGEATRGPKYRTWSPGPGFEFPLSRLKAGWEPLSRLLRSEPLFPGRSEQ